MKVAITKSYLKAKKNETTYTITRMIELLLLNLLPKLMRMNKLKTNQVRHLQHLRVQKHQVVLKIRKQRNFKLETKKAS